MQRRVELVHHTNHTVAMYAARTCTDTEHKTKDPDDQKLLLKCIEKGHESVLEHIVYTFKIEGISRALLQELARHRIASLSVMSTRWALKKTMKQDPKDILVSTGVDSIDRFNRQTLHEIQEDLQGYPNDKLKYVLPEAIKTKCVLTINLRSFRNMVKLRMGNNALREFRGLVRDMVNRLPGNHRYLLIDVYKGEV